RAAYTVTDADIAAVKAAAVSEDQIFELAVCAAIGQATRQYDAALAALDAATEGNSDAPRHPREGPRGRDESEDRRDTRRPTAAGARRGQGQSLSSGLLWHADEGTQSGGNAVALPRGRSATAS